MRLFAIAAVIAAFGAIAPAVSASAPGGLSFAKMCTADGCTVTSTSDAGLVPLGSTLTYSGPRFDPHLSSGFVLDTGTGTVAGHCTLSWATGLGHCILEGGTGSLAGLHAVFSEWVDFADGTFENFVFHLDGTVHIE